MNWKQKNGQPNEITCWVLEGLDFEVKVIQVEGPKYGVRCDGFNSIDGFDNPKDAKILAASYAKQRVVQLSQKKLEEINSLLDK